VSAQADNPAIRILEIILALALLGGLFFAGWRVYHSLPGAKEPAVADQTGARSELTIVLREGISTGETKVELYPIDFAAMQRDFRMNGSPGNNLEEFLARQLRKLVPVDVQIDKSGRAVARLSAGNWWLRAISSSANGEVVEWRVPLTISQPAHTIELSGDNAYERAKKF
jgi:hypothetical protein